MEISSTILAESSELKDKPRKKRKANVPTNSINEISEQS